MLATLLPPLSWLVRGWVSWRVTKLCTRGAKLLGTAQWEDARDVFQEAVNLGQWVRVDYVQALHGLAAALGALGDLEAATKAAVRCVSAADAALAPNALERRMADENLALLYEAQGRCRGAVGVRERLVRFSEDHESHEQQCQAHISLSRTELYLGDLVAARRSADRALVLARQSSLDTSDGERCLGAVALHSGQTNEAVALFEEVERRQAEAVSTVPYRDPQHNHGDAVDALNLATSYVAANRLDDAERWVEIFEQRRGEDESLRPLGVAVMGELRRRQGQLEDANHLLRLAIATFGQNLSESHWRVARARVDLAKTLARAGDRHGSAAEAKRAVEALDPQVNDSHPVLVQARVLAAGEWTEDEAESSQGSAQLSRTPSSGRAQG